VFAVLNNSFSYRPRVNTVIHTVRKNTNYNVRNTEVCGKNPHVRCKASLLPAGRCHRAANPITLLIGARFEL